MVLEGNIENIKDVQLIKLDKIVNKQYSRDFLDLELINDLVDFFEFIRKEILILINRKGFIVKTIIGSKNKINILKVKDEYKNTRAIHFKFNNTQNKKIEKNILSIKGIESIISINIYSKQNYNISVSFYNNNNSIKTMCFKNIEEVYNKNIFNIIDEFKENKSNMINIKGDTEKVIILGSQIDSLEELKNLVLTAGGKVIDVWEYRKDNISSSHFLSKGKMNDLRKKVYRDNIDTIVFDDELNKTQNKNLGNLIDAKVIDRTMLILDIFAKHAKTKEGKLQVLLAQLEYRQNHLIGTGKALSRLAGGIGTRGPGETKLEIDRRHIRNQIVKIKKELKNIELRRKKLREQRKNKKFSTATIVGYTNSGKSSLLNAMCKSSVYVKDKLFATLDPSTRKLNLPSSNKILVTDTVGFIKKLPHVLIEAFKSTLEEAIYTDLLIIVADVSDNNLINRIETVFDLIDDIGAGDKKSILVLNKTDLNKNYDKRVYAFRDKTEKILFTSVKENKGIKELINNIDNILFSNRKIIEKMISYKELSKLSEIHDTSNVIEEEYLEDKIRIKAIVKRKKDRNEESQE